MSSACELLKHGCLEVAAVQNAAICPAQHVSQVTSLKVVGHLKQVEQSA